MEKRTRRVAAPKRVPADADAVLLLGGGAPAHPTAYLHRRRSFVGLMNKLDSEQLVKVTADKFVAYVGIALGYSTAYIASAHLDLLSLASLVFVSLFGVLVITTMANLLKQRATDLYVQHGSSCDLHLANMILSADYLYELAVFLQVYVVAMTVFIWFAIFGDSLRQAQKFNVSKITATLVFVEIVVAGVVFARRYN